VELRAARIAGPSRLRRPVPVCLREQAKALLTEAGYDAKHPLRYTLMIPGAEPLLTTVATIMKAQYAKLGVEVTVEILDRSIFLRRVTRDHNWDQLLQVR
jgi:ABC-type transport system substrate-binding protein